MSEEKNLKKGDENMEAINKPQEAMMIAQGMTRAFIDLVASQKCSKDYWNEWLSTKKTISSSTMDKLKELCNGERNDVWVPVRWTE